MSFFSVTSTPATAPTTQCAISLPPLNLPSTDPFSIEVNKAPQNAFELTSDLFGRLSHLATCWLTDGLTIRSIGNKVAELKLPSLVFLYFVFCDKVHTQNMAEFYKQSTESWNPLINGAWGEFITNTSKDFAGGFDPKSLPGFCSALSLDLPQAETFVADKKWEEFITWVFTSRKNQFDLN